MAKEKICGIYCIENKTNGKKYIGLSKNIYKRWNDHKSRLNNKIHENIHLQRTWDKYGEENFSFNIIIKCVESELTEFEIYYIKLYNTNNYDFGYNMTIGGEDGYINDDVFERKSIAITKRNVCQIDKDGNLVKTYRNSRFAGIENNISISDIHACCNKRYGRKSLNGFIWMFYDEYLEFGLNIDDYKKVTRAKPVSQHDIENNFIDTYESAREAEIKTGISYKLISQVCNGDKKQTHGYIFRFI